jgi:glycosyltransferase involved in cell wall biosynthesis
VLAWSDDPLPNYQFKDSRIRVYRYKPPVFGSGSWKQALRFVIYAPWAVSIALRHRYYAFIGFDQNGLIAAYFSSLLQKDVPLIYYVPELHISSDQKTWIERLKKSFEIYCSSHTHLIVCLGERPANALVKDNHLDLIRVVIVPNGPLAGNHTPKRTTYLKDLLSQHGIFDNKIIFLHMGTIADWTRVKEIVRNVEQWPSDSILVIHGWGNLGYINAVKEIANQYKPSRVIFSTMIFDYDELNELVGSADVGIALYDIRSINDYEMTSGKLFEYMKAGIPSITCDFPNLKLVIEDNQAGICVRSDRLEEDLVNAVNEMVNNEDLRLQMGRNARRVFVEKYAYEKGFASVLGFLDSVRVKSD